MSELPDASDPDTTEHEDGMPMVPGAFYWAQPVFDVDGGPDHWSQFEQPARFDGYGDAYPFECWTWLGVDNPLWPARWIGRRITGYGK